jgi:hypothetical protein
MHRDTLDGIVIRDDGTVVTASADAVSAHADGRVFVWDL